MSLRKTLLNLPITKKLVLINFIVVMTALCITGVSIMLVQASRLESVIVKEMQTQADVISYNVAAALSFGDPIEAENILSSLSKVSTVVDAAVFDVDHVLFSRYHRMAEQDASQGGEQAELIAPLLVPEAIKDERYSAYHVGDRHLHIKQGINIGDEYIGLLYLKVSLDHLYGLRNKSLMIFGLALIGSLLFSLLIIFWLQKFISEPVLELSDTIKRIVQDKTYSIRATKFSDDELGVLTDGFNEMLDIIERRDEMLNAYKGHLEEVVQRRISDLEHSNDELQETVEALKEASKTLQISEENKRIAEESAKTKARFLANMSHELRTPMNGVLGMLNLLDETPLRDDQAEYTHLALDSAGVLLATLDEILDIAKIEAGKLTIETNQFDLFQVIDEVFGVLGEAAFKKGVELVWFKDAGVVPGIVGDAHRTKQILYNLVSNAIKFTEKGYVSLQVRAHTEEQRGGVDPSARYQFVVTDTGVGIDISAQERIFDSFTQADDSTTREFGGTGLGLALCKELTCLMGGDVSVKSVWLLVWMTILSNLLMR